MTKLVQLTGCALANDSLRNSSQGCKATCSSSSLRTVKNYKRTARFCGISALQAQRACSPDTRRRRQSPPGVAASAAQQPSLSGPKYLSWLKRRSQTASGDPRSNLGARRDCRCVRGVPIASGEQERAVMCGCPGSWRAPYLASPLIVTPAWPNVNHPVCKRRTA